MKQKGPAENKESQRVRRKVASPTSLFPLLLCLLVTRIFMLPPPGEWGWHDNSREQGAEGRAVREAVDYA